MANITQILREANNLSVADKAEVIEQLSASLRRDLEIEAFKRMPWQEFLKQTSGSLADTPIERPPQPPLQDREPLE